VNATLVMVVHIIADQVAEMWLVQGGDVVENLAAATTHPAFRDSVLPRCLDTRSFRLKPVAFKNTRTSASNLEESVHSLDRTSGGRSFPRIAFN
jgi:hypothetical protein